MSAGAGLFTGRKANNTAFSLLAAGLGVLILLSAVFGWGAVTAFEAQPPWMLGAYSFHFRMDFLSSLFLALLGTCLIPVSIYSSAYLSHLREKINCGFYWSAFFLFVVSVAFVFLSADCISFLVFWETMSLSSLALVASDIKQKNAQKASLIYFGATRVATAFLSAGFLWMHSLNHSWNFADWSFSTPATYVPAFLIMIGFCIKAGIFPFHIWMPYAYPEAPSPSAALMSGVMSKTAVYGIIRVLMVGNLDCAALSYTLLVLGGISTFWGLLFALVQQDLKRLLAYSSVENIGIIFMSLAFSLIAKGAGLTDIACLALIAAIFHSINHGLFKSLLFLCAGGIEVSARTRDLREMGGLGKRMPWTMACFTTAALAACALPPLNGFASKWFLYQGFLHASWESLSLIDRTLAFAGIGVLTIAGGLSLASFSKAIGVAFLGNPRSGNADHAIDLSLAMRAALFILASLCLLVGLCVPLVLNFVLAPVVFQVFPGTKIAAFTFPISLGSLAICLMLSTALIYVLYLNRSRIRKIRTWECGFGSLTPRMQVNPDSYSQPLAKIFRALVFYKTESKFTGIDRSHFPEHIKIETHFRSHLENYVYLPALGGISFLAKGLARIQAGSIHLYLLYLCATLIFLLVVGTHL